MGISFVAFLRALYCAHLFKKTCTYLLRCVVMCCDVLRCVAVCCSVLRCVAACCGVLRRVAVCCSVALYVFLPPLEDQKGAKKRTDSRDCEILSIRSFYIVL